MDVHLVDGTYELFRSYFGAPSAKAPDGREVGAVRGLLRSLLSLVQREGATHVGVAFDRTVESFRNAMFAGYKTGEGLEPELLQQFGLAEEAVGQLGLVVWPMVEFEADDALATAADRYAGMPEVDRVWIASPDKDLAQCVRGSKVVRLDRMRKLTLDEAGVAERFGVSPATIPDWLALVGDRADGIPGLERWGAKSSSAVLARYGHIEAIPAQGQDWDVPVRGAPRLAQILVEQREDALLYRQLATLRLDVPLAEEVGDLEWRGARGTLRELALELGDGRLEGRVERWR